MRQTVTVFDHLPWVDIEMDAQAIRRERMTYLFPFAVDTPRVIWEVPGGHEEADPPLEQIAHLRWLRVGNLDEGVLWSSRDAPFVSVDANGGLTSHAPPGLVRYRLAVQRVEDHLDTPWVFGWGREPFSVARVRSSQPGRLPTFGRLLVVDPVGVVALGMVRASDGHGVIVYVQDIIGLARHVTVGFGLIRFRRAEVVDYVERGTGEVLDVGADGVTVPVAGYGVTAVRLSGIELNTL
jgi:hypothetical protein